MRLYVHVHNKWEKTQVLVYHVKRANGFVAREQFDIWIMETEVNVAVIMRGRNEHVMMWVIDKATYVLYGRRSGNHTLSYSFCTCLADG